MDDDIFGNPMPPDHRVDQSYDTDAEGGGYRFLIYGNPGQNEKKKKKAQKEKHFDPGQPVEIHLSDDARRFLQHAENAKAQEHGKESENAQTKKKTDPQAEKSLAEAEKIAKHINVKL